MRDDHQYGFTLGFGLNVNLSGNQMSFDYAYRDMQTFDGNQYFTLRVKF